MLLGLMRKHAQTWIIKSVIAMIALVFIFYFGYNFTSDEGIKVAEVNGESIGRREYEKAYRDMLINLQNEYKDVWSDKLIDAFDLKTRALEGLIQQKIINQEAEKMGLMVTKNEIQERILEFPTFFTNGRFDESKYRYLLTSNHITPEEFEKSLSTDLLQQKLTQFLTTFLILSDQEIRDNYTYANEKIKLAFVKFSPDEFKESIQKEKEAVNSFFEERKESYRAPEKIKIAYIKISPASFRDKVKLDDDVLKGYYEDNIDTFTQENQVKARHILFKVAPDASPEDQDKIKEKAESVLERAKKGEDFSELAKEFSDDPSKSKGGDLGYFTKGRMVKEFEDAAFSLKKDEISDLVKTTYGYHIIKVDDIRESKVKTFDEVRGQIDSVLRRTRSVEMAEDRALSLIDQIPYDIDLKEFAADHEAPFYNSEFFSRSEPIPMIRSNSKLVETLFNLQKGDVTELIELNNEFYIMQVIERKDSYLPELDEVLAQVEEDYVDNMALEMAAAEAEKYLQSVREKGDWEALAKEKNRTIETTDFFSRRGNPGKIGSAPGLQEEAFKLDADNPYPEQVFKNNKGAYVVKWEEKQGIDPAKYEEEKEMYGKSLTQRKQQEAFLDWIDRMKAKSKIDTSYFDKIK